MRPFFKILVRDIVPSEISNALIEIFGAWNLSLASEETKQNYGFHSRRVNFKAAKTQLRAVLVSPQEQRWCSISPSHEVWFGEAAELSAQLSGRLTCPIFLLLHDYEYDWGYFLYEKGVIIDKFHTDPDSPTLREREVGWPELLPPVSSESVKEYEGNPEVLAKTFEVEENRVSRVLSIKENVLPLRRFQIVDLVVKVMKVPDLLIEIEYYEIFNDVYFRIEDPSQWTNLVFTRKATMAEIEWSKTYDMNNTMGGVPALWVEFPDEFKGRNWISGQNN